MDRNLITIPRLHYMQRGKNQLRLAKIIVKNKMSRFFMVYCVYLSSYLISVPFFFFVDCRVRVRVSSRVRDSVSFILLLHFFLSDVC